MRRCPRVRTSGLAKCETVSGCEFTTLIRYPPMSCRGVKKQNVPGLLSGPDSDGASSEERLANGPVQRLPWPQPPPEQLQTVSVRVPMQLFLQLLLQLFASLGETALRTRGRRCSEEVSWLSELCEQAKSPQPYIVFNELLDGRWAKKSTRNCRNGLWVLLCLTGSCWQ